MPLDEEYLRRGSIDSDPDPLERGFKKLEWEDSTASFPLNFGRSKTSEPEPSIKDETLQFSRAVTGLKRANEGNWERIKPKFDWSQSSDSFDYDFTRIQAAYDSPSEVPHSSLHEQVSHLRDHADPVMEEQTTDPDHEPTQVYVPKQRRGHQMINAVPFHRLQTESPVHGSPPVDGRKMPRGQRSKPWLKDLLLQQQAEEEFNPPTFITEDDDETESNPRFSSRSHAQTPKSSNAFLRSVRKSKPYCFRAFQRPSEFSFNQPVELLCKPGSGFPRFTCWQTTLDSICFYMITNLSVVMNHIGQCSRCLARLQKSIWMLPDCSKLPANARYTIDEHAAHVVAESCDSRLVAAARAGSTTIKVFHLNDTSGKSTFLELVGHKSAVMLMAFSPNNPKVLVSTDRHHVYYWDLSDSTDFTSISDTRRRVDPVIFGSHENIPRCTRPTCTHDKEKVTSHDTYPVCLAMNPIGFLVVIGYEDGYVFVWDSHEGEKPPRVLNGHDNAVTSLAFDPLGKLLATGSKGHTVRIWELDQKHCYSIRDRKHKGISKIILDRLDIVSDVAFSSDGSYIVAMQGFRVLHRWQVAEMRSDKGVESLESTQLAPLLRDKVVHQGQISPFCNSISFACSDGVLTAELDNIKNCQWVSSSASVNSLRYSSDERCLVIASDSDLSIFRLTPSIVQNSLTTGGLTSVSLSPDHRLIASENPHSVSKLAVYHTNNLDLEPASIGNFHGYTSATCFSPTTPTLVLTTTDRFVYLQSVLHEEETTEFSGHEDMICHACFSPMGDYFASVSLDQTVRIWNISNPTNLTILLLNPQPIQEPGTAIVVQPPKNPKSILFSSDSRLIAIMFGDGTVDLWDLWETPPPREYPERSLGFVKNFQDGSVQEIESAIYYQRSAFSFLSRTITATAFVPGSPSPGSCSGLLVFGYESGVIHMYNVSQPQQPVRVRDLQLLGYRIEQIQFGFSDQYMTVLYSYGSHMNRQYVTAIFDLSMDGAVTAFHGEFQCLSRDGEMMLVRHHGETLLLTPAYLQLEHYRMHYQLKHRSGSEIAAYFNSTLLHPSTRFLVAGRVFDIILFLTQRFKSDVDDLGTILHLLPGMQLYNLGYSIHSPLQNALLYAIRHGLKDHTEKLIIFASEGCKLLNFDNSELTYFYLLPFSRLMAELAVAFPELACMAVDAFMLDVTVPEDKQGPNKDVQRDFDQIRSVHIKVDHVAQKITNRNRLDTLLVRLHNLEHAFVKESLHTTVPVLHKVSLLPDLVNLLYWRTADSQQKSVLIDSPPLTWESQASVKSKSGTTIPEKDWRNAKQIDPLEVFCENDTVDAFRLPVIRAVMNYRWTRIYPFYLIKTFLYILFLASYVVFSLHLAYDDTSTTLGHFYDSPRSRVPLAFGILCLVLNVAFLVAELLEYRVAGSLSYFKDFWNYIDNSTHLLVFVVAGLHIARREDQYFAATVTALLVWFKLLLFFDGFRGTGMFIRLVFAIVHEIRYFLFVWVVIMLGFANAFFLMFRANTPKYGGFGLAFVNMFAGSTNSLPYIIRNDTSAEDEFPFPETPALYNLQLVIFVLFTLTCNVLLLNLLIALMGSVFAKVNEAAAPQYRLEKAKLLLSLEQLCLRFPWQLRHSAWLHIVAPEHGDVWLENDQLTAITHRITPIDDSANNPDSAHLDPTTITLNQILQRSATQTVQIEGLNSQTKDIKDHMEKLEHTIKNQNDTILELLRQLATKGGGDPLPKPIHSRKLSMSPEDDSPSPAPLVTQRRISSQPPQPQLGANVVSALEA